MIKRAASLSIVLALSVACSTTSQTVSSEDGGAAGGEAGTPAAGGSFPSGGAANGGQAGVAGAAGSGRGGAAGIGGAATAGTGGGGGASGAAGLGDTCLSGSDCVSGFCADSVCCDQACDGPCEACVALLSTSTADGICAAAPAGTDPRDACVDEGVASCGQDGSCDGTGACRFYEVGVECDAASCAAGLKTLARTCDGLGRCQDAETVQCAPAACDGALCAGDCPDDDACLSGEFCNLSSGDCELKRGNGEPCQSNRPNECSSGHCADGVCCDDACTGQCRACTASKKGSGQDGSCGDIAVGLDPDDDCSGEASSTCGRTGACDGSGSCELHDSGTVCQAASCSGSTETDARICDGSGSCQSATTRSCSPYTCAGASCRTSCSGSSHCVSTHVCQNGSCVDAGGVDGSPCSNGGQCNSGHCVDGVCCESSCTGTCRACNQAPNLGECRPIVCGPGDGCPTGQLCANGFCAQECF